MTVKELYDYAKEHDVLDTTIITYDMYEESVCLEAHSPYCLKEAHKDEVVLVFT